MTLTIESFHWFPLLIKCRWFNFFIWIFFSTWKIMFKNYIVGSCMGANLLKFRVKSIRTHPRKNLFLITRCLLKNLKKKTFSTFIFKHILLLDVVLPYYWKLLSHYDSLATSLTRILVRIEQQLHFKIVIPNIVH